MVAIANGNEEAKNTALNLNKNGIAVQMAYMKIVVKIKMAFTKMAWLTPTSHHLFFYQVNFIKFHSIKYFNRY